MSGAAAHEELRIGDAARQAGCTPRTIRYYEEIGLLTPTEERPAGHHRLYSQAEVERLREILRLKQLLGLSLDELKDLLAAEDARAALREEFRRTDDPERRRAVLQEGLGHLDRQLDLVRRRRAEVEALEQELAERRERVTARLRELDS